MMVEGSRTHGGNSSTTCGLVGDRGWGEGEDDLLLQIVTLEQLSLAVHLLRNQGLESLDCSWNSEKCLEELRLGLICSIFVGSSWSWGSGSSSLRLGKCLNGSGHETSDDELSDGNHDY